MRFNLIIVPIFLDYQTKYILLDNKLFMTNYYFNSNYIVNNIL